MMRAREGLASNSVDPFSSPLKEELKTAKFTVLPTKDENGAALAVFNARLHDPSCSSHKITLQGIHNKKVNYDFRYGIKFKIKFCLFIYTILLYH